MYLFPVEIIAKQEGHKVLLVTFILIISEIHKKGLK